jgi:hypothetical protein
LLVGLKQRLRIVKHGQARISQFPLPERHRLPSSVVTTHNALVKASRSAINASNSSSVTVAAVACSGMWAFGVLESVLDLFLTKECYWLEVIWQPYQLNKRL